MLLMRKSIECRGFRIESIEGIREANDQTVSAYRLVGEDPMDRAEVSVIWHNENRPTVGQFYVESATGEFWLEPEGFDQQRNVTVINLEERIRQYG